MHVNLSPTDRLSRQPVSPLGESGETAPTLAGRNSAVRVHTRDYTHMCTRVCADGCVCEHTRVYIHLCLYCARLHDYMYVCGYTRVIVQLHANPSVGVCMHVCVCEMTCVII